MFRIFVIAKNFACELPIEGFFRCKQTKRRVFGERMTMSVIMEMGFQEFTERSENILNLLTCERGREKNDQRCPFESNARDGR